MRIRIISGSYGLHDGRRVVTMTARSGPFEVEDAEGAALIAAGTAEPCESEVGSRESEVVSSQSSEEVNTSVDRPRGCAVGAAAAAAGVMPAAGGQSEVGSRESEDDSELVIPSSELDQTVDYLTLSLDELRALCYDRGIRYKKNAGVKALAALLAADDDRPLPELLAAEPVEA